MKSLADLGFQTAQWETPHLLERNHELRCGGEVVATLQFLKAFGSLAEAESADGRWTFKRGGFLRPQLGIRDAATQAELGLFHVNWRGEGLLELGSSGPFEWKGRGFWRTEFTFSRPDGALLMHFTPDSAFRPSASVVFDPTTCQIPATSLLACLGWYLIVLAAADGAAAAVIVG